MKFIKNLSKYIDCKAGILTNQSAYGWNQKYHFEAYRQYVNLTSIFIPEHGLFAELQDQVSGSELDYFFGEAEIVNLYGDKEESLFPSLESLKKIDIMIIDIRDVGSRYYTFLTTAFYIIEVISKMKNSIGRSPTVVIVDSPNPIGQKVEGSPLKAEFESFVGVRSVLHRHGLTPAGLLNYYNDRFNLNVEIATVPVGVYHEKKFNSFKWIPPSPNIPTRNTCFVYPGQCLLEGTNLSEGRGTTKPFETFGSPFLLGKPKEELDRRMLNHQRKYASFRSLRFRPTFHKYKDQICEGYQLLIEKPKKFHSLYFSLFFLRNVRELFPDNFEFPKDVYEFRSDRPAIELLAGDPVLLAYLNGEGKEEHLLDYLKEHEKSWFSMTKPYRY